MKKIDFDNDSIKKNILQAALPMLAAQILSLLYNIVDRIYIARIPDMGDMRQGFQDRRPVYWLIQAKMVKTVETAEPNKT